jgi:hypothetical protein
MNPLYPSEPQTTNLRIQSLCGSQLGVNALIFVKVAACAMRGKNRRLMMVFGLPFALKLIEIIQFTHDLRSR